MPETTDAVEALRALPEDEIAAARRRVRVLIMSGLGLNCEAETEAAFALVGASPERVHLLDLLDGSAGRTLGDYDVLAFIGGFAFGDHLGAGFVFANKIRWRLYDQLLAFIESGGHALGVCNGFQTMVRLGLLPGLDGDDRTPRATLAPNDRLGYRDACVRLGVDPDSPCAWTRGLATIDLPATARASSCARARACSIASSRRARCPCATWTPTTGRRKSGRPTRTDPRAAAGLCDPSGRLFGLMPHPDACLYPFHHPEWPRRKASGRVPAEGSGLAIFRNGVDATAAARA